MAGWNGSGVFSRLYSWISDDAAGINITASRMDGDTDLIVTQGLGNCLTRDGQGAATANQPMNGFKHTGVGAAVDNNDYMTLGQLRNIFASLALGINFANLGDVKQTSLIESDLPRLAPGWRICDGSTRPRTDPLWIQTGAGHWAWGTGDGSTTYTLPDLRGRLPLGKDNMGGSAANRVTVGVSGVDASVLTTGGGDQALQQHTHAVTDPGHGHTITDAGHNHAITDPGHTHLNSVTASPGASTALALNTSATIGPGEATESNVTGVLNQANTTGVVNQNNTTGVANAIAGVGVSQNIPPVVVVNYIIFVGA
jgi:microcystin-dependent protein